MAQEKTGGDNSFAIFLITLGLIGTLGSAGNSDYETEANYRFETTGDSKYDIPLRSKKTSNIIDWASAASLAAGGLLLAKSNKENER